MKWTLYQYLDVFTRFSAELADEPELEAEVDQRLLRLKELGNQARMPISEPLGDGVFACRASSAQHHARMLYCFLPQRRIVIVLCALKDQRRLNPKDVVEAKKRKLIVEANEERISGLHQTH